MHPDLAHALSVLEAATRPAFDAPEDRRDEDVYEAITTLEALGDHTEQYADCLWGLLAHQHGPQPRHQAKRALEALRGIVEGRGFTRESR